MEDHRVFTGWTGLEPATEPALAAGGDVEMLEDLVAAACNDAVRKAGEAAQQKMSGLVGGMPVPPGFKMPL